MKHSKNDDKNNALPAADCRVQLFNKGAAGLIQHIQVSRERIYQQLGIMMDIDPHMLRDNPFFTISQNPDKFYAEALRQLLDRDSVLSRAMVIASGTGLQVVLKFAQPEPCETDAAREMVEAVIEAVLPVLPIDPDQPGIIATRRRLDSVNSKNGKKVRLLAKGEPIPFADVADLAHQMITAPFQKVMSVLTGELVMSPCPLCQADGSTLKSFDHYGLCYGSCGKVSLQQIWKIIYQARPGKVAKEVPSE